MKDAPWGLIMEELATNLEEDSVLLTELFNYTDPSDAPTPLEEELKQEEVFSSDLQSRIYLLKQTVESQRIELEMKTESNRLLSEEIVVKDRIIALKDEIIDSRDKAIAEKDAELAEKNKAIIRKNRDLVEKEKAIDQKDRALNEIGKIQATLKGAQSLQSYYYNLIQQISQNYIYTTSMNNAILQNLLLRPTPQSVNMTQNLIVQGTPYTPAYATSSPITQTRNTSLTSLSKSKEEISPLPPSDQNTPSLENENRPI